jgi:hypothetical protein
MALLRHQLDLMQCDDPACAIAHERVYLHSRCHPEIPVFVYYDRPTGNIVAECALCGEQIVEISVAEGGTVQ